MTKQAKIDLYIWIAGVALSGMATGAYLVVAIENPWFYFAALLFAAWTVAQVGLLHLSVRALIVRAQIDEVNRSRRVLEEMTGELFTDKEKTL